MNGGFRRTGLRLIRESCGRLSCRSGFVELCEAAVEPDFRVVVFCSLLDSRVFMTVTGDANTLASLRLTDRSVERGVTATADCQLSQLSG